MTNFNPWPVLFAGLLASAMLLKAATAGQPKPKHGAKEFSSVAEMTSRATALNWHASAPLKRLTVLVTTDQNDDDCVMGLAEFDGGQLGIYQSRQAADDDRFFLIQKADLDAVHEAIDRCRR